MTTQESLNRTVNLLGTSVVGLAGFAFMPEIVLENDAPDKVDDILLFLLALGAMWWYNRAGNKYLRSVAPVVFVVLALVIKIGAVVVEHDDAEAVGDDMGGLILFILSIGLVAYQYVKTGKLLAASAQQ